MTCQSTRQMKIDDSSVDKDTPLKKQPKPRKKHPDQPKDHQQHCNSTKSPTSWPNSNNDTTESLSPQGPSEPPKKAHKKVNFKSTNRRTHFP